MNPLTQVKIIFANKLKALVRAFLLLAIAYCQVQVGKTSPVAFSPITSYPGGTYASTIGTGDFNKDGKPDLVVLDQLLGQVHLLLGDGNGNFSQSLICDVGVSGMPFGLAVGDFNRDGNLDLAVINFNSYTYSSNVVIMLGNGDGTFKATNYFTSYENPLAIASADLNHDGIPDLLIATSSHVNVLIGKGDGSFVQTHFYGTSNNPASIAIADFNGDGKPDFAISAEVDGNDLQVYMGNGDGSFNPMTNYSTGGWGSQIVTGDFNHDGKIDMAVANLYATDVAIFLGSGNGKFRLLTNCPVGINQLWSLAAGDFNSDGNLDLAVADNTGNTIDILLGNGDGTFQSPTNIAAGGDVQSIIAVDLNGDGQLDLAYCGDVAPSNSNSSVHVLINTRGGQPSPLPIFFNGEYFLGSSIFYHAFPGNISFGYYSMADFPCIYHFDFGWFYFFDAVDASGGCYIYDFTSGTYFYTAPDLFPYLYDFSLSSWLYYYPELSDPGHYTKDPRYFFDFTTGKIIQK